jgi:NifU-like protein involved in Fe-S cluster formation
MSLPLPEPLKSHFLDKRFRGFNQKNNKLKSTAQFLSIGSLSEGRVVELAWIIEGDIFKEMRFRAFGDAYVIGCFSWLCFCCEGHSVSLLSKLSFLQIARDLKIPDHKLSCLVLLDDAINNIIKLTEKTVCKKMKN